MEKKEAVREWCFEWALRVECNGEGFAPVEEVIKTAKKIEKYIIG